jgi:transposase
MMGKLLPQQPSLFAFDVNLELRIPSTHPLRKIKKLLDLSFADALVESTYGKSGHVSLPPQTILRMLFLLFYYDIPSERELCHQVTYRLDFLWFLDLDLDSPVPNHSVLSKARARWGAEIFQELFMRTVQQCVRAGLVSGQLLHIDSTIIAANASKDSVTKSSPELVAALRQACQKQEQKLEIIPAPQEVAQKSEAELLLSVANPAPTLSILPSPEPVSSPATETPPMALPPVEPALTIVPKAETNAASTGPRPSESKAPVNQTHVSLTDPEAELARDKSGVTRLCYKEHRMVDDLCGVITALKVTGSTVADGTQLPELYEAHQALTRLGVVAPAIAGDKHYGTASNYRYCSTQGVRAHLGEATSGVEGRGLFGPQRFTYEPQSDQFRCPAGHCLRLHQTRPELCCKTYQIERAELCAQCPLRPQCTRSKHGRSLQVADDYQRIAAARIAARSAAARHSRKRRRHVMEGSFADAMNNHGAKRARWRGRKRQEIQTCLIAAIQNLRILLQREFETRPTEAEPTKRAAAPEKVIEVLAKIAQATNFADLCSLALLSAYSGQPLPCSPQSFCTVAIDALSDGNSNPEPFHAS